MTIQRQHRFFIYVRKSTGGEEQQARSIGDQLAEIRRIVTGEHLDVVGSFEESQSAMTKGRPQFNQMLDRIEAGEADGIIAWHPDRLARNAFDGGRIIDLLDEGRIAALKFCSFWFENTAQGKLMLNLAFGQSKYFSDTMSVNIRRAQRQKTEQGIWSWRPPVGYFNEPKLRTIAVDPVRAPLVREAFELYAAGQYTLTRLREVLNAKGLRNYENRVMSLSRYQDFLKNPFYYGVFILRGEMHQGSHEPLVTKQLFDAVKDVMKRRSKPSPVRLKTYVYRGLMYCGECGCVITMETQKGAQLPALHEASQDGLLAALPPRRESNRPDRQGAGVGITARCHRRLDDRTASAGATRNERRPRRRTQANAQRGQGARRQAGSPHGCILGRRGVLGRRVPQAEGKGTRRAAKLARQDGRDPRRGRITVRTGDPVHKRL
ncbi:MAG TPA: recombinase family protein [Tepidisphaeraceae bacterium]|nr:recombinase family protein [Tepidisphaeraceae bacterium]